MIYYNIALRAKIIKINRINKIFSNHFNPLIIVRSTLFYYSHRMKCDVYSMIIILIIEILVRSTMLFV